MCVYIYVCMCVYVLYICVILAVFVMSRDVGKEAGRKKGPVVWDGVRGQRDMEAIL